MMFRRFLILLIFLGIAESLKCYLGYSIMKGSTVGTETKECEKETDYCYNGTADVSSFSTLQKAGCNTVICQFNPNKCFEQNFNGQQLTFCCCNTADLCNGGDVTESGSLMDRGLSVLKGIIAASGKKK